MILACAIVIFSERHIKDVMLPVLDAPMFPRIAQILLCRSLVTAQEIPDLRAILVALPALPKNHGDTLGVLPLAQVPDVLQVTQDDAGADLLAAMSFALFFVPA